jgi:hypothetical protein
MAVSSECRRPALDESGRPARADNLLAASCFAERRQGAGCAHPYQDDLRENRRAPARWPPVPGGRRPHLVGPQPRSRPLLLPEGYRSPIPPLEHMPPQMTAIITELREHETARFVQRIYAEQVRELERGRNRCSCVRTRHGSLRKLVKRWTQPAANGGLDAKSSRHGST